MNIKNRGTAVRIGKAINNQFHIWLDQVDECGMLIISENRSPFTNFDVPMEILYVAMNEFEGWIKNHGITRYRLTRNYTQESWTLSRIN